MGIFGIFSSKKKNSEKESVPIPLRDSSSDKVDTKYDTEEVKNKAAEICKFIEGMGYKTGEYITRDIDRKTGAQVSMTKHPNVIVLLKVKPAPPPHEGKMILRNIGKLWIVGSPDNDKETSAILDNHWYLYQGAKEDNDPRDIAPIVKALQKKFNIEIFCVITP